MNRFCSIFSQLLNLFPRLEFDRAVRQTNMLEEDPKDIPLRNGCVKLYFRPFEIKTLRCEL